MNLFGGVALFGSIAIVANFVLTCWLIGCGFKMADCIWFSICMGQKIIILVDLFGKYKIETI